ncbi:hypothetical protein BM1_09226 [Bipolaris maydis]|nr:hypothetical protein BM1_09226 [Bipolaris maydis]KAJ6285721.1 hypothetical protein J3E71DRAFT_337852 [Bipolaris maydis]
MAREDEGCLEGRRYALYAEIVGPTDIGWHRPRNDVEVAHGAPTRVVSPAPEQRMLSTFESTLGEHTRCRHVQVASTSFTTEPPTTEPPTTAGWDDKEDDDDNHESQDQNRDQALQTK